MRRKKAPEGPTLFDHWSRINARVLAENKALEHERQAGRGRNRNKNSNWTPGRQVLSEIARLISDRHGGACDTDDSEAYFTAALPWLVEKGGGFQAEGCEGFLADWVRVVTPRLDSRTVSACISDARQRDIRRKLYWRPAELGALLRLTVAERESLGITKIRPGGMTPKQFTAYQRKRKTAAEKARRATKGATPREQTVAQTKPWEALGMARRTYYRHMKASTLPACGTHSCPADTKYLQLATERCHVSEQAAQGPARTARPRQVVGAGGHSPRSIPKVVRTSRLLPPPLPEGRGFRHPDLLEDTLKLGAVAQAIIDTYRGGIMPIEVVRAVETKKRAEMMLQKDVARRIGVSPPQLTNVLRRRVGLSPSAATNLREWLVAA